MQAAGVIRVANHSPLSKELSLPSPSKQPVRTRYSEALVAEDTSGNFDPS
jgi:hypothetical protein